MSAQGTPKQWDLEGNWNGGPDMGGWITTPHCVFEINPICGSGREIVADIRLIAAVPKILAALEKAAKKLTLDECIECGIEVAIVEALGEPAHQEEAA